MDKTTAQRMKFLQGIFELEGLHFSLFLPPRLVAELHTQFAESAKLKVIAAELITKAHQSVTIDWTLSESARAKIKVMVKRILNKYGYPPDLQEEAVKTVIMQGEMLCAEWV